MTDTTYPMYLLELASMHMFLLGVFFLALPILLRHPSVVKIRNFLFSSIRKLYHTLFSAPTKVTYQNVERSLHMLKVRTRTERSRANQHQFIYFAVNNAFTSMDIQRQKRSAREFQALLRRLDFKEIVRSAELYSRSCLMYAQMKDEEDEVLLGQLVSTLSWDWSSILMVSDKSIREADSHHIGANRGLLHCCRNVLPKT